MKKLLLIIALIASANSFAQKIKFEIEEFNFGEIKQGESLTHEFKYTNTGDEPLTLSSVNASCGCIIPEWSKEPLAKGQTASVKAVFNTTNKMGMQDKTIVVMSNSSSNSMVILHLKGEVSLTEVKNNPIAPDATEFTATTTVAEPASKQEKSAPKQVKLPVFNEIIDVTAMMGKTYWSLGVNYQKSENTPLKPETVISDIHEFVNDGKTGHEIEKSYLKKYKGSIDSTFDNMRLIGSSLGEFVYMRKSEVPIRFCSYKDVSKVCFITGIAIDNVYNTLKLTSRQRARKVLTEFILPSLKNLKPILSKEFDYVGLGAIYGCKNLSEKYSLTKEEYLAFIVSCKKVKDFLAGNLSEDELVESADIISADSDMVTGTKRIKITLE